MIMQRWHRHYHIRDSYPPEDQPECLVTQVSYDRALREIEPIPDRVINMDMTWCLWQEIERAMEITQDPDSRVQDLLDQIRMIRALRKSVPTYL